MKFWGRLKGSPNFHVMCRFFGQNAFWMALQLSQHIWREKHSTPHLSNISLVMIPPPPLPSVAKILAASRHTTPPPAIPTHLKIWCALRRPCNPNDLPILHPKLVLPPAQKKTLKDNFICMLHFDQDGLLNFP